MNLDIDKILDAPKEKIEQNDLERLKGLGILNKNIYLFDTLERPGKHYWVKKCEYDGQPFFIFNYFSFSSDPSLKNHIDLKKYLQSDEPNIILQNCNIENQKDIKDLNKIKQAIIATNSEFPNISSCEFLKEVYVEGYACFHSCTFNNDFVSKNAKQDISFTRSIFNKSFTLSTEKELGEVKFEATHFKQKFTMDIRKFSVLYFSCAEFDCELALDAREFNGTKIDFTKAMFKQKVSFHRSIFNCEMLFKEACFEDSLIFTKAKFNDVVNLSKVVFKEEVHFHGTKFNKAIISETNFENKADFSNAIFNEKAYFRNAIFTKTAKLNNILFKNNAYFKNTLFKDFVDFGETNFENNANFYSANFEKPVNFSSIIFNDALNFVNAKTDFTYEELKKFIEDTNTNNIEKCISATNDFRDGFRLMKHALNNKGNALDASLFHRLELYCKELELEFTLENAKDKNSENDKEEAKPKSKSRIELFLDLITLKLYRNTSDHHTNLFQIINFAILSIAVYGLSFLVLDDFLLKSMIDSPKILTLLLLFIFLVGLLACLLYFVMKYKILWATVPIGIFTYIVFITPGLVNAFDYSVYVVVFILLYVTLYALSFYLFRFSFVRFMTYLIFMAIFLDKPVLITPFIGIFTSEKIAESKFEEYIIKYDNNGLNDMLLDANFTNIKAEHKINFIVKNRKIILERLDNSRTNTPLIDFVKKYIKYSKEPMDNNVSYKNLNETTKKSYEKALNALKYDEAMQSIQKSANLLYIFIMLLVIYSLTKTARRNSVVPS
nr:pentapeptide repeat-containing protein [uncultured Campylobacter sp.]